VHTAYRTAPASNAAPSNSSASRALARCQCRMHLCAMCGVCAIAVARARVPQCLDVHATIAPVHCRQHLGLHSTHSDTRSSNLEALVPTLWAGLRVRVARATECVAVRPSPCTHSVCRQHQQHMHTLNNHARTASSARSTLSMSTLTASLSHASRDSHCLTRVTQHRHRSITVPVAQRAQVICAESHARRPSVGSASTCYCCCCCYCLCCRRR
jgi:hypothetical protein